MSRIGVHGCLAVALTLALLRAAVAADETIPVPAASPLASKQVLTADTDVTDGAARLGPPSKEGFVIKLTDEEIRLLNLLQSKPYQFGWSGGFANKLDDQKAVFFDVTPIRVDIKNRYVILRYDWRNGVLNARIKGREMSGDWVQGDDAIPYSTDSGRFCLRFAEDLESATGWWHDDWQLGSDAKPIKHWAYFRAAQK
jgi:hypothetical protein